MKLLLGDIAGVVKGKEYAINREAVITAVSSDTRTISQGSIFVGIKGDKFDGGSFAVQALKKGATAVIVEEGGEIPTENAIVVKDSRRALLEIAGLYRKTLPATIVTVTGSVGKTTTKEMIACVLESQGKTLKTRANLNNEVGLSQMILELDESFKYAVLEIGVDGPGQMLPMTLAANPDIALVTNIGTSHLQNYSSIEAIQEEKLTIRAGLKKNAPLILNGDDKRLRKTEYEHTLFYGLEGEQDIRAFDISSDSAGEHYSVSWRGGSTKVNLPVMGRHNVLNSLAAFGVGLSLGISGEDCAKALENYKTEGQRQKVVKVNGYTVVEDCYNAGPQSMEAAMTTLAQMQAPGRKIAVLGDMFELGNSEKEYHKNLGKKICSLGIDILLATGELSRYTVKSAAASGMKCAKHYENKEELGKALRATVSQGDVIWLKASRGMRLEEILSYIYDER